MAISAVLSKFKKKNRPPGIDTSYPQPVESFSEGYEDDDPEILKATIASLIDTSESLESQVRQLKNELATTRQQYSSHAHDAYAQDGITEALGSLNTNLHNQIEQLRRELAHAHLGRTDDATKIEALEVEKAELTLRLQSLTLENQTHRIIRENIKAENERLHQRIQDLKSRPAQTQEQAPRENPNPTSTPQDVVQLLQLLRQEREESARQQAWFRQQIATLQAEMAQMSNREDSRLAEARNHIAALELQGSSMVTELVQLREGQARWEALVGYEVTPRAVLMMSLLCYRSPSAPSAGMPASLMPRSFNLDGLTREGLDVPLSKEDLGQLIEEISLQRESGVFERFVSYKICSVCQVPRIQCDPSVETRWSCLNEFPQLDNHSPLGDSSVCKGCYLRELEFSIENHWWQDLDSLLWLQLPGSEGRGRLEVFHRDHLIDLLNELGDQNLLEHINMYNKASILRSSLEAIQPRPSPAALTIASMLHKELEDRGYMYHLVRQSPADQMVNATNFRAGRILLGDVDRCESKVPIFLDFFRRSQTTIQCYTCIEDFNEIEIRSQREWEEDCASFRGSWMQDVLVFPTSKTLYCEHRLDMCKDCFQRHLASQLEQYGAPRCDQLSCPECSRVLTREEIQYFTSEETFQKYENFRLLNYLSTQPNFRRCLREGCSNGQVYDNTEYLDPHIMCEVCEFDMCFTHQVPWHDGLTCEEYDSQREHGDPNFAQTQRWVHHNTKACPGPNCGVITQKDAGCFHMTCRVCRHEYCWECLADWSLINPSPGVYNKNAHRRRCWFRTSDTEPTQITGNNLQEVLQRQ